MKFTQCALCVIIRGLSFGNAEGYLDFFVNEFHNVVNDSEFLNV